MWNIESQVQQFYAWGQLLTFKAVLIRADPTRAPQIMHSRTMIGQLPILDVRVLFIPPPHLGDLSPS